MLTNKYGKNLGERLNAYVKNGLKFLYLSRLGYDNTKLMHLKARTDLIIIIKVDSLIYRWTGFFNKAEWKQWRSNGFCKKKQCY